ncbi:hypothetical protein PVAND_009885 [Polypedilum vanderplanki]|uniref:Poly [ADP-ribose] polymerase n=1 Tax=Polypedilum vanderplanki TaxID=319348 RepID=A0A9J6CEY8_POLVA|nr:hypothetical protein PVAND_009885 [Polypedilum vanderplanki]
MHPSREEKLQEIKSCIENDLLASDLKISLFTSAAKSFKKNFLLNPFPSAYLKDDIKDFDRLIEDLDQIPSLEELLVILMAEFDNTVLISNAVINLLHWILIDYLKYDAETVPKSKHEEILSLSKSTGKYQAPNYIFRINYKETSAAEKKFNQLKIGQKTKFAYHGTKFCNAYTILNYGLQQHLNKTALFGEGLYFAFEIQVSLLFSQSVGGWQNSKIGNLVSCIAICEYIDDPNYSKIRKENAKNNDIPQNYLLITNNEIVRVRYLMIYGSNKPIIKSSSSSNSLKALTSTGSVEEIQTRQGLFLSWCRRNPLIVSVFLYMLLLILVGFSNHRSFEHYKRMILDFLKRRFKFE